MWLKHVFWGSVGNPALYFAITILQSIKLFAHTTNITHRLNKRAMGFLFSLPFSASFVGLGEASSLQLPFPSLIVPIHCLNIVPYIMCNHVKINAPCGLWLVAPKLPKSSMKGYIFASSHAKDDCALWLWVLLLPPCKVRDGKSCDAFLLALQVCRMLND